MRVGSRPYRWTGIRAGSRREYMREWNRLRRNPATAFHEGESPYPEQAKPTGFTWDREHRNAYLRWWRQEQKRKRLAQEGEQT